MEFWSMEHFEIMADYMEEVAMEEDWPTDEELADSIKVLSEI